MFTGLSDNREILNNFQKIHFLFQKVQDPIMTQIKASLQVSCDLNQANTVIYNFISISLAEEAATLGYHTPEESRMSTLVARKHHKSALREQVAQYSSVFNPIGPSYWTERTNLYLTRGSDSISRAEGSASPLTRKIEQGCIHQVQKESSSEDPTRDLIFKSLV